MTNLKIAKLSASAIEDCQNLRQWVIKNDSRNDELLTLVGEVEELINRLNSTLARENS